MALRQTTCLERFMRKTNGQLYQQWMGVERYHNERCNLYEACSVVGIKTRNEEVEQNFFVQNQGSYEVILLQPYINAIIMGTKVLDDQEDRDI